MTPASDSPRVLIADDQSDVLDALRLLLRPEGMNIEAVASPAAVVQALEQGEYDLLLMDLNYARDTTSGREGLDLLSRVRAIDHQLPVVVMTGWASMETAIEALRFGVRDFVQKPWDNRAVIDVVNALTAERQGKRREQLRLEREMREAREIQQGLWPTSLPQVAGWDIAARCQPAAAVGGDLYDILRLDEGTLGFVVADVAGKGVPAALLAASVQSAVRSAAAPGKGPALVCEEVNRALCGHIPGNRFVTFFYGVLDAASGAFTYANAGHNPPFVVDSGRHEVRGEAQEIDGRGRLARDEQGVGPAGASFVGDANGGLLTTGVLRLGCGGVVLGIDPDSRWRDQSVAILPGDALLLYTDGLTEARSEDGEEFGEERLADALRARAACPANSVAIDLLETLSAFGPTQDDDRTVIVVRRTG